MGCVMVHKVVSTFLPDVHSDLRGQNPQLAGDTLSLTCICRESSIPNVCHAIGVCSSRLVPPVALESSNWLTRRGYENA